MGACASIRDSNKEYEVTKPPDQSEPDEGDSKGSKSRHTDDDDNDAEDGASDGTDEFDELDKAEKKALELQPNFLRAVVREREEREAQKKIGANFKVDKPLLMLNPKRRKLFYLVSAGFDIDQPSSIPVETRSIPGAEKRESLIKKNLFLLQMIGFGVDQHFNICVMILHLISLIKVKSMKQSYHKL